MAAGLFACGVKQNNNLNSEQILDGLNLSYVKDKKTADGYIYCYQYTKDKVSQDSITYSKAVDDFYKSDPGIIDFLLKFENEKNLYNYWIVTEDPCSAVYGNMFTHSRSSLILIDNYLRNDKGLIDLPVYEDKLSYEKFKEFYTVNKDKTKEELKQNYTKYLIHSFLSASVVVTLVPVNHS